MKAKIDGSNPRVDPSLHVGEKAGAFDFERYRGFCDAMTDGSRKVGLLDKDATYRAIASSDVVTTHVADIPNMPLMVPIDDVVGYDPNRCKKMAAEAATDVSPVAFYSLPPGAFFNLGITEQHAAADSLGRQARENGLLLFIDHSTSSRPLVDTDLECLVSSSNGLQLTEIELREDRPEYGEENQYPAMHLYSIPVEGTKTAGKQFGSFKEARDAAIEAQPDHVTDGTIVYSAETIAQNPEVIDALWEIYKDRFTWLAGKCMPVSLEDSKADLVEHLTTGDTTTAVLFKDGTPQCFMYLMEDPAEACFWLSDEFFKSHAKQDDESYNLFFPGIVSRKTDAETVGSAKKVIHAICDIVANTDKKLNVLFESTNVSSTYIPGMVEGYVNEYPDLAAQPPQLLDTHEYRLFKLTGAE